MMACTHDRENPEACPECQPEQDVVWLLRENYRLRDRCERLEREVWELRRIVVAGEREEG